MRRGCLDAFRALVTAVALVFLANTAEAQGTRPPNVVLCMADDQGYGDVGYYGNPLPHTPNLDAMAAACLRLDRSYAAAPVCSPTRGSVLTGRHPNRFGCFRWGYTLRPSEVTLPELLRKAGYRTGHFGKWHLGSVRSSSPCSPGNNGFDTWLSSPNFYENDPWMSDNGRAVSVKGESSEVAMKAALAFMREAAEQKRPFLAVVWFGSPHNPHVAHPIDKAHYAGRPKQVQNYYGEVTGIDRAMGTLRSALRASELADDTIVWYTSDNGARRPGSNGGLRGAKGQLWEGGIRVPTLIEWPAIISRPRTSNALASTVDILPTLIDLAGVTRPENAPPLDGSSLRPLIEDQPAAKNRTMGFWDVPAPGLPVRSTKLLKALAAEQKTGQERPSRDVHPGEGGTRLDLVPSATDGHAAWMEGPYKLHRIVGPKGKARYELYHLARDRAETKDLAVDEPRRVARMGEALSAWQQDVIRSCRGEDYGDK